MSKTPRSNGLSVALAMALCFGASGCAVENGNMLPGGSLIPNGLGCVAGGIAGAAIAKVLVRAEAQTKKMTAAQMNARERGYLLGLAAAGCAGGALVAGTAYAKMSARGKENRQREMQEAVQSATVRTYTDPENPRLVGKITPQEAFDESETRQCKIVEDNLAESGKGEPAFVKWCRTKPNLNWTQALA